MSKCIEITTINNVKVHIVITHIVSFVEKGQYWEILTSCGVVYETKELPIKDWIDE